MDLETIVAPATAPGRSGVAVIRMSGPLALEIGRTICGEIPQPMFLRPCSIKNSDEKIICRGAIESLSENTSDGIIAPLFWAFLFGLPGIVFYKAINTLDSMIGYKNDRYFHFGWATARLDDLANFVPARLSAFFLCIAAFIWSQHEVKRSWIAIRHDARKHLSINAGYPEAAMAGALNLRLAGPRDYEDQTIKGDWIGIANEGSTSDATEEDIGKGLLLYVNACILLTAVIVFLTVFISQS